MWLWSISVAQSSSAVEKLGLVYSVEFVEEGPLYFQIALARYGEQGRRFVVVESVARPCVGRAQIKPTDELVAVNGKVIVEPTSKDRLTELLRTIAAAPPDRSTLTFCRGRRSGKARRAAAAVAIKCRARVRRLAVRPEPRRLGGCGCGARHGIMEGGGVCWRRRCVRSVRRLVSAAGNAVASTEEGLPLGAGRRRGAGAWTRAARGPRGEGPGVAGARRRDRGVSGLRASLTWLVLC